MSEDESRLVEAIKDSDPYTNTDDWLDSAIYKGTEG